MLQHLLLIHCSVVTEGERRNEKKLNRGSVGSFHFFLLHLLKFTVEFHRVIRIQLMAQGQLLLL